MPSQLEQLQAISTLVAAGADYRLLQGCAARDASADHAAIVQALGRPDYAGLLTQAVAAHRGQPLDAIADRVLVRFGCELLEAVPGRVTTPVDARQGFDTAAIMARAQRLVELYRSEGVPHERVLIGVAASWEGIQAAKALAHHGILCSMGGVHAFCQAVAAAEAGVALIAPQIGPGPAGAAAVADMWRYFRKFDIDTEVMACGFESAAQVLALAGCDLLALEPGLLAELQASEAPVARALDAAQARGCGAKALTFNEPSFRYALNEDGVAGERLAAGLRAGAAAARSLDALIEAQ